MTSPAGRPIDVVERFLRGDGPPTADVATLHRANLAPLAYARLPTDDPRRDELRHAFTRASARHLATKAAFLPLARAWRDAGIDVIVFKGFYLAEFAYPHPGLRHYNDVDVVVRPDDWDRAESIAVGLGWTVAWRRRDSLYRHSHEEAILRSGVVEVEVHRLVIDCSAPDDRRQRRMTEAAWAASSELAWEGTVVRALAPADSLLMGLVLARSWSGGDDWHLKPADYPDLRLLAEALGVSLAEARSRAERLGCERTFELFLQRCDPWRGVLDLEPPSARQRRRWNSRVASERGHLGLERALTRLRRLPGTVVDTLAQLPTVLRAQRALRRGDEPVATHEPAHGVDAAALAAALATALATKERIVRGVKWAARLVAIWRDPCRVRSRALYDALRTTPYAVRLNEGRASGDARVHAWVEVDGVTLRDLHDARVCRVDEVVACYRSQPSGAPPGAVRA